MLACVPLSALGLQVPRASIRASAATAEASTGVSTAEVAKLFGRFAENVLHLDRDVGACCHSACSDCEWRTPDGGREVAKVGWRTRDDGRGVADAGGRTRGGARGVTHAG